MPSVVFLGALFALYVLFCIDIEAARPWHVLYVQRSCTIMLFVQAIAYINDFWQFALCRFRLFESCFVKRVKFRIS